MQDQIFTEGEGTRWFQRNRAFLNAADEPDEIVGLMKRLSIRADSVAEVGCSNGWRLEKLRTEFCPSAYYAGFDASREAIEDGRKQYPAPHLYQSTLAKLRPKRKFDLVSGNFARHWVDRGTLLASIAKLDEIVNDRGGGVQ